MSDVSGAGLYDVRRMNPDFICMDYSNRCDLLQLIHGLAFVSIVDHVKLHGHLGEVHQFWRSGFKAAKYQPQGAPRGNRQRRKDQFRKAA
jgi:hypothetical protein